MSVGAEAGSSHLRLAGAALLVALLWTYWPTLAVMAEAWSRNPQYSHGYLVPLFAVFLLWSRRQHLATARPLQSNWCGVLLVAAGLGLRLSGAYVYFDWLEAVSLLPALAGIGVLVGGWPILRWSWPAIGFLFFMMPLPYTLETALAYPLRRLATVASTYALQTIGLPALAEGNIILLNEVRIGVVEACSGLSMLMVFFALSSAMALLVERPLVDKIVVVVSAVPVALLANVARITITGLLHETAGSDVANAFFHDVAGWLMMPLALAILWLELKVLSRLFVEVGPSQPVPIGLPTVQEGEQVKVPLQRSPVPTGRSV